MEPRFLFSQHATGRMLRWHLNVGDVTAVLSAGETIEEYDDGAELILGRSGVRPVHVVIRRDEGVMFVITAYEPDPHQWDATFRVRRGGDR